MRHLGVSAGVDGAAEHKVRVLESGPAPDDVFGPKGVDRHAAVGLRDFKSADVPAEIGVRVFALDGGDDTVLGRKL